MHAGAYSLHLTATLSGPALLSTFCTEETGSLDSPKDPQQSQDGNTGPSDSPSCA